MVRAVYELSVSCRNVFRWLADRGCRKTRSYDGGARAASYELNRIITPGSRCRPECFEWNIGVTSVIIIALVPVPNGGRVASRCVTTTPRRYDDDRKRPYVARASSRSLSNSFRLSAMDADNVLYYLISIYILEETTLSGMRYEKQ